MDRLRYVDVLQLLVKNIEEIRVSLKSDVRNIMIQNYRQT